MVYFSSLSKNHYYYILIVASFIPLQYSKQTLFHHIALSKLQK